MQPLQFWSPPPNQARILCRLAKAILKFHKTAPEMNYDYSNPKFHAENVQFRADSPMPASDLRPPPSGSTADPNSANSKIHTENVHFCADSSDAPAETPKHRPTETPASLLSEPAPDYQLFLDWLQLPPPRKLPSAAKALDCSLHRLRRLSAKYKWRIRAADFDDARARSTRTALEQMLQDQTFDWRQRTEAFRQKEWRLYEQMLDAAMAAAEECARHPNRISMYSALRMIELSFEMGRRAAGMPVDGKEPPKPLGPPPGYLDFEAALHKIYGNPEQV
jgi:hypothetical protein